MPILKRKLLNNCIIMGNEVLQRTDLSLAAKGLLGYMLSLPEDWDFTIAGIAKQTGESQYKIGKLLNELQIKGYHIKKQLHENGKIKDWIYYIFAESQESIVNGTFLQELENQDVEKQEIENSMLNKSTYNKLYVENNLNKINKKTKETYIVENNTKNNKLKECTEYIIQYLNDVAGTKYKSTTKGTANLIKARFKEGFRLDDFYDVIDKKWKEWKGTEWEKYIRPETLFGNKFENYLNGKQYFSGNAKTNYSSKPIFDNTVDHTIPKGIAEMSPKELEYFKEHELAKDENGNYEKF